KEIAYFVAPPQPRSENGYQASDFAMSKPAFAPARREIWFTDGTTGFYVLRVDKRVWPQAAPRAPSCQRRRRFLVGARVPRGARVRPVRVADAPRQPELRVPQRAVEPLRGADHALPRRTAAARRRIALLGAAGPRPPARRRRQHRGRLGAGQPGPPRRARGLHRGRGQ